MIIEWFKMRIFQRKSPISREQAASFFFLKKIILDVLHVVSLVRSIVSLLVLMVLLLNSSIFFGYS